MRIAPGTPGISDLLQHQTVRFVITGGAAAMLFYALTFAAIRLGAPPFAGTLGAYVVAFVVSYSVQHAWTFGGQQAHGRALPRYLVAQVVAALVAGTAARSAAAAGFAPALTALASTLCGSALSYVLSRYWVFAPHR